jgi:hypothetical protein
MKPLDPFDASVLNVLARVPQEMSDLRERLLGRLRSSEGKAIARVILAPEGKKVRASKDVQVTAASLKRSAAR